jgi:hypothetical protein
MPLQHEDLSRPARPATPGRAVSTAAFLALRSALQGFYREKPAPAELRRALRLLCQAGRREGAQVEHLLIIVKQALVSAADACDVRYGEEREEFSRRAITMCIEEFYADAGCAPAQRAVVNERGARG